MIFSETSIFTKQIVALLPDEEYRKLQRYLVLNPGAGDVIQGSAGLRKVRWKSATGGKRGGILVIYYWYVGNDEIFLLLAYGKREKDDLSAQELKILRQIVRETMT